MADMEKDKEQDKRLDYIDIELASIKSVTHGSDVHQWEGIVSEHKSLEGVVNHLKENSDFVTKFFKTALGIIKVLSIIGGLFLTGFSIYHIFN